MNVEAEKGRHGTNLPIPGDILLKYGMNSSEHPGIGQEPVGGRSTVRNPNLK